MNSRGPVVAFIMAAWLGPTLTFAQIDPTRRDLIQIGYNAAFEGHPPLSAYAFYYRNQPGFWHSNLTLRLAVSPTYLDSELGVSAALGPHTDVGFGIAGGGFADSYYEIDRGTYRPAESFDGYGGQASFSLYHLFNPERQVPLYGILRGTFHYATYAPANDTAPNFRPPDDMGIFSVRGGLRLGGREPVLFPALAMELSIWYEGQFRTRDDVYGFGDRQIESQSHLFWVEAFLAYTLTKWKHNFSVSITAGTSIDADRLSTFRIGGLLPMVNEFPLSLPGYYFQELSVDRFVLFTGNYIIPLDRRQRWNISATVATAGVDYLPGLEQPGHWNSGVGGGLFYTTPSWRIMVGYGYGIDAIRSHGRGAHSIGFLLQLDLGHASDVFLRPASPGNWRGLQRILGVLGS